MNVNQLRKIAGKLNAMIQALHHDDYDLWFLFHREYCTIIDEMNYRAYWNAAYRT